MEALIDVEMVKPGFIESGNTDSNLSHASYHNNPVDGPSAAHLFSDPPISPSLHTPFMTTR
ncbi:hypothetical protein [Haloferula sp.]|uniref:hypothetical protein n=1 Tax=Haloferula sp. TaxID=2497595 RepID=UPI003C7827B6